MSNRSRATRLSATVVVAVGVMGITASCTHRHRPPWRDPTTTRVATTPPTTDGHGHTDEDHANMTTTTAGRPTTTAGRPTTTAGRPTTTAARPTTTAGHGDHDH
jgi:hypothetical protein